MSTNRPAYTGTDVIILIRNPHAAIDPVGTLLGVCRLDPDGSYQRKTMS
jgi:hypothetical protein